VTRRPTRRGVAALALCLLVVGAGCGGLADRGGTAPPGLSADGVTDATALVGAHTAALSSTSFTVRTSTTTRPVDGEYTATTNRTWRVAPGDTVRGLVTSTTSFTGDVPERVARRPDALAAYREGTVTYRRVRDDGETSYRRVDLLNTSVRLNPALQRRPIARLDDRVDATVEPVTREGRRRYRVTARLNDTQISTNATLRLLVTPAGVVRDLRSTRTVEYRSGRRIVTRTVRVTDVGETTVERPDWFAAAVEATGDGEEPQVG
jgi:hypothetical protein